MREKEMRNPDTSGGAGHDFWAYEKARADGTGFEA